MTAVLFVNVDRLIRKAPAMLDKAVSRNVTKEFTLGQCLEDDPDMIGSLFRDSSSASHRKVVSATIGALKALRTLESALAKDIGGIC